MRSKELTKNVFNQIEEKTMNKLHDRPLEGPKHLHDSLLYFKLL